MSYGSAIDGEGAVLYLTIPFRGLGFPLALLCAAMGTAATSVAGVAGDVSGEPSSLETAALDAGLDEPDGQPVLPRILAAADEDLYREIFALQVDGHWKQADRRIARLGDRLLMGHVLAQRYLHPTKYRSRYTELRSWMADYADHPEARRIYKLALRRKPSSWRAPKPPTGARFSDGGPATVRGTIDRPRKGLTGGERRQAGAYKTKIHRYLRKGWTKAAKELLRDRKVQALLSTLEYDRARARLGAAYFSDGRDQWAFDWAAAAARRSGRHVPEGHWTAGLAAWRLGRHDEAHRQFEVAAAMRDASPWLISASAFWAARSHLRDRQPDGVNRLLGVAAGYPRTFYGLLARRILGLPITFRWSTRRLERAAGLTLAATPGGRRALALVQVGRDDRAEPELRILSANAEGGLARAILALASRAAMPRLAMRLAGNLFPGVGFDGAHYPVPPWTPKGGFRVDRALIFALIRQESAFDPKARSGAGASGLMQLMPGTAGFVANDRRYRSSKRRRLFEPALNLELGQTYVEMLLGDPKINGDLFHLAVAWNGGPGNLSKWWRTTKHLNDPLLFIESIPVRETRIFIERVLANLWIYRNRLGQPTPSLDALAAGEWPVYVALDKSPLKVARHDEDRR